MDARSSSDPNTKSRPSSLTLIIRDAKTSDPRYDQGIQRVHIPHRPNQPNLCVISILSIWLSRIGLLKPDFSIHKSPPKTIWPEAESRPDRSMPKATVIATLRQDMSSIGFPKELLHLVTAHRMRTGGACDLRDSGTNIEVILTQGRWRGRGFTSYLRSSAETSASVLMLSPESDFAIPLADLRVGDGSLADKYNHALNSIHLHQSKVDSGESALFITRQTSEVPPLSPFISKPPSIFSSPRDDTMSNVPVPIPSGSTPTASSELESLHESRKRRSKRSVQDSTNQQLELSPSSASTSATGDLIDTSHEMPLIPVRDVGLRSTRGRTPKPTRLHGCDAGAS